MGTVLCAVLKQIKR